MKRFLSIAISALVFVVFACLPIIPVSVAPIVPNPTYSFRLKNSINILWFAITRPDGVSYQWNWWTLFIFLITLAIGCLTSIFIFRKIRDLKKS